MAVLTTMFVICALRTNVIFFYMFFLLVIVELLLSASYWVIAEGRGQTGQSLQVVSFCHSLGPVSLEVKATHALR